MNRPARVPLVLALACIAFAPTGLHARDGAAVVPSEATAAIARLDDDARRLADWIERTGDNGQRPFYVVDKRNARLHVFDANARLVATSPVLLGLARGDESVPGIGERKMSEIRPHERTTPAGRFIGERGRNHTGETIVWVDYDAAVSMHRVRANDKRERRLERLASATIADNRISYGCINVPAAFYDAHVWPVFAQRRTAMVYVLPETRALESVFPLAHSERVARTAR
jgi:hypothetical protein